MITVNTVMSSAFSGDVLVTKAVASLTGLIWAHGPLMHDGWGKEQIFVAFAAAGSRSQALAEPNLSLLS